MKIKNLKITLSDGKYLMFHFDAEKVTDTTIKRLCRVLNTKETVEEELAAINSVPDLKKEYTPDAEVTLLYKHGDEAVVVMECVFKSEDETYVRGKIIDEINL